MHGIEIGDYYLINYHSEVIRGVVFKYHGTENYFVITDKGRKYDVNYYNFMSKIPEEEMSLKVRQIVQMVKEINGIEKKLDDSNKKLENILLSLRCQSDILSNVEFEKIVRQNLSNKVKYALRTPHKYRLDILLTNNLPLIVISTSRVVCSDLRSTNYDFVDNLGTGYFIKSVNSPMYFSLKEKEDKEALKYRQFNHSLIKFMTNDSKLDVEFGTNVLKYYDGCTLVLNGISLTEDNAFEVAKIINTVIR